MVDMGCWLTETLPPFAQLILTFISPGTSPIAPTDLLGIRYNNRRRVTLAYPQQMLCDDATVAQGCQGPFR